MKPIESLPLIPGEIADYRLSEEGILYSYSKSPVRTIENINNNVRLVQQITGGRKVPLLIFLSKSPVPDKATRIFSRQQLPVIYTAMAMVGQPGLSQLIMRILFKFQQPPIPMKSFTDEEKARDWLLQYVQ
ncbi:MAG TPA: STAS/SEC14 domain-containing protein [Flavitalea sp.]|nr:STAS/SEC14 domain-containing protein [Flavitalea sp.]